MGAIPPMSNMAASARDKLQASARELMKNFEDVLSKSRSTLSSSGGGGDNNQNSAPPPDAGGAQQYDQDGNNIALQTSASVSLENAFRTLFASCTSPSSDDPAGARERGDDDDETSYTNPLHGLGHRYSGTAASKATTDRHQQREAASSSEKELGEDIYAQLFFDDQIRAAKAVNAMRSSSGNRNNDSGTGNNNNKASSSSSTLR